MEKKKKTPNVLKTAGFLSSTRETPLLQPNCSGVTESFRLESNRCNLSSALTQTLMWIEYLFINKI